jgi:hypothetical protein
MPYMIQQLVVRSLTATQSNYGGEERTRGHLVMRYNIFVETSFNKTYIMDISTFHTKSYRKDLSSYCMYMYKHDLETQLYLRVVADSVTAKSVLLGD